MYALRQRALLVVFVLAAAGCGAGPSSVEEPGSTIQEYYEAFNAGDLDAVMALFTEESQVVGHPFGAHAEGLDEIRAVFAQEVNGRNRYTISNLSTSGTTVTWDHVYNDDYCRSGHIAVIRDHTILTWTWPNTSSDCD